jgi:hypothetical protein
MPCHSFHIPCPWFTLGEGLVPVCRAGRITGPLFILLCFATSPNVRVALQQCFGLSVCDDHSQRQVSLVALHVTHDSNIAVAFDGQLVVLFECERLFGIRHFAFAEVGSCLANHSEP